MPKQAYAAFSVDIEVNATENKDGDKDFPDSWMIKSGHKHHQKFKGNVESLSMDSLCADFYLLKIDPIAELMHASTEPMLAQRVTFRLSVIPGPAADNLPAAGPE